MKKERKKAIKNFAKGAESLWLFTTLKKDEGMQNYTASLTFDSYSDLMYTLSDLLKVSQHALYHAGDDNIGDIADPGCYVASVLKIVSQLLPLDESEILDNCHQLYLKLKELEKT